VSAAVKELTEGYLAERNEIIRRLGPSGPGRRYDLVEATDRWLAQLYRAAGGESKRAALVAVGGYGRGDLSIGSDIDLLLLTTDDGSWAQEVWYPIWDSGISLDHSVRSVGQARKLAGEDFKVLLGLLDARCVAGDELMTANLLGSVRKDWRAFAPKRLEEIRASVDARRERSGELAHLLEPDLKESYGGLRDLVILQAIAASWITDSPHTELSAPKELLLNVRDALHLRTGKASDRLLMQEQEGVSAALGYPDPEALMRDVSRAGRAVAFASDSTWYRVNRATRRSPRRPFRRLRGPDRRPLADGVIDYEGEVVLAKAADPATDPGLLLRAAAAAANNGLNLTPHTVTRLAQESAPLPVPWPRSCREAFVSLLGAGRSAVTVWESLDQADLITRLIPQWEAVRSAPQRNPIHRFTVDRHLVETAVAASKFQRDVQRPDLLLVGALFHDIGKGRPGIDHTDLGVELMAEIGPALGFSQADSETLVDLVRYHLMLPEVATRRDPDDPATIEFVAEAVGSVETLDLLYALTRADSAATGPAAWSDWRAALIRDLVHKVRGRLSGVQVQTAPPLVSAHAELIQRGTVSVVMDDAAPGDLAKVTVVAPDRTGLLADVAGVLSVNRLDVRASRVATEDDMGVSEWWVGATHGSLPSVSRLRTTLKEVNEGTLDVADRLQKRETAYAGVNQAWALEPRVDVVPDASDTATVIEVRTYDRPGALYRLAGAIAAAGLNINAARVDTLGSNVVDVFYLTSPQGTPLGTDATTDVVKRLEDAARA